MRKGYSSCSVCVCLCLSVTKLAATYLVCESNLRCYNVHAYNIIKRFRTNINIIHIIHVHIFTLYTCWDYCTTLLIVRIIMFCSYKNFKSRAHMQGISNRFCVIAGIRVTSLIINTTNQLNFWKTGFNMHAYNWLTIIANGTFLFGHYSHTYRSCPLQAMCMWP